MFFEPPRIVIERAGIHAAVVFVAREHHFLEVSVKLFLFGAIQDRFRMCPIAYPEGVIRNDAANGYDAGCKKREEKRSSELLFHGFVLWAEFRLWPGGRILSLLTVGSGSTFAVLRLSVRPVSTRTSALLARGEKARRDRQRGRCAFPFPSFYFFSYRFGVGSAYGDCISWSGAPLMFSCRPLFLARLGSFAFAALASNAAGQDIQYTPDPNAAKNMTLLLKDWAPVPMLHAAKHEVLKAKFYVIDVHNHVNDAAGGHGETFPAADVVKAMDAANVKKIVILTGLWGEKLQGVLDKMVKPYPDRFIVFAQMDWSKIDDPNFSEVMVAQIDDAVKRGARGLKILKDWGLGVRDKSGKLVRIDDPRMDPVWEECGKLGIPVAIHSTDPEAFFTPADAKNERYEELMHNPGWSFYGSDFPGKVDLLEQRNRVFAKHPHTLFIALHVANWPENLDAVSDWLKKYPNMYVEFGARQAELGRQPHRALKFFTEFQDRILFGTDAEPIPE